MKRKILITLLTFVCVLCFAFGLTACGGGSDSSGLTEGVIYVSDLSVTFTSESESPNGEISETSKSASKSVSWQKCYIVIDFGLQMSTNNDSGETITLQLTINNASAVECRVDYADTGIVGTSVGNANEETTTLTATFSLPETAYTIKNERVVVSVTPQDVGEVEICYDFLCDTKLPYVSIQNDSSVVITQDSITFSNVNQYEYSLLSEGGYQLDSIRSSQDTDIVIKSQINGLPVISIAANVFYGKTKIESVTIPDSVKYIGEYAFYKCSALKRINSDMDGVFNIPNNVTSIGSYAFDGCTLITSVNLPDSVTSIGGYAFSDCTSLSTITLGSELQTISEYAFNNCSSLTSITIPYYVTTIGSYAFSGCTSLGKVSFENAFGWYIQKTWTILYVEVIDESQNVEYFVTTYVKFYWYRGD